jgi:hypothetical protein
VSSRRLRHRGIQIEVRLSEPARLRISAVRNGRRLAALARRAPAARFRLWLHAAARPGRVRVAVRAVDRAGNATVRRFTLTVT